MTELTLFNNKLDGVIPTQVGGLSGMTNSFRLERNTLTATLPTELGRLSLMVKTISLKSNKLTGSLPTEVVGGRGGVLLSRPGRSSPRLSHLACLTSSCLLACLPPRHVTTARHRSLALYSSPYLTSLRHLATSPPRHPATPPPHDHTPPPSPPPLPSPPLPPPRRYKSENDKQVRRAKASLSALKLLRAPRVMSCHRP